MTYQRGTAAKSYRAAQLYLQSQRDKEGLTIREAAERHGISISSVHQALERIRRDEKLARKRECAAWPEDEVTC